MRNQNSKVRVIKRKLSKCKEVCRTFSPLQYSFADKLEQNPNVIEFRCNVQLVGLELDGVYTTDFVITKADGDTAVRECILRDKLTKPLNVKSDFTTTTSGGNTSSTACHRQPTAAYWKQPKRKPGPHF